MASPTNLASFVDRRYLMVLFDAIRDRNLDKTRTYLRRINNLQALKELYPVLKGKTALHLAAMVGHITIVRELMEFMSAEDLVKQGDDGYTPLVDAIYYGSKEIVEYMVGRNKRVLEIPTNDGLLPVALAFMWGYSDIGEFLYRNSPHEALTSSQEGITSAATVLTCTISLRNFDIALDLLRRSPQLVAALDIWDKSPVFALACTAFAFPSGNQLDFWQQLIYNFTPSKCMLPLLPGILKRMNKEKQIHEKSKEVLSIICDFIKTLDENHIGYALVHDAIFEATERGILEIVTSFTKVKPELLRCTDKLGRNIFMHAIKCRQEKIYRYLCDLPSRKAMAACVDNRGNNALHLAGLLAPDSKLRHIPGEALKMQRELQWFKEIEKIMLPHFSESKNFDEMMTPRETFMRDHKVLMIEGEKWMKETASFCIVASALVVTIMFAAAITIPGGNHQDSGFPIFLDDRLFRVFIFSNVVSVFSSTISVLQFLGIITSRYSEEDFLKVLPTRMTLGVTFLFLSIATMLIAFVGVIFIMFTVEPWIRMPIILLSTIPVIFFAWQIFPLLTEIILSTYFRRIFNRNALSSMIYICRVKRKRCNRT